MLPSLHALWGLSTVRGWPWPRPRVPWCGALAGGILGYPLNGLQLLCLASEDGLTGRCGKSSGWRWPLPSCSKPSKRGYRSPLLWMSHNRCKQDLEIPSSGAGQPPLPLMSHTWRTTWRSCKPVGVTLMPAPISAPLHSGRWVYRYFTYCVPRWSSSKACEVSSTPDHGTTRAVLMGIWENTWCWPSQLHCRKPMWLLILSLFVVPHWRHGLMSGQLD